jgi:hypothetical protein
MDLTSRLRKMEFRYGKVCPETHELELRVLGTLETVNSGLSGFVGEARQFLETKVALNSELEAKTRSCCKIAS